MLFYLIEVVSVCQDSIVSLPRIQCDPCGVNYVGETVKRLQTRVTEHVGAVRRMDPSSLVAEHCAKSGHTFAFENAKILGRGNDHVTRETIEAWHTETTSINRCVVLPVAYQALRAQLIKRLYNDQLGCVPPALISFVFVCVYREDQPGIWEIQEKMRLLDKEFN
ncbi:unnamed protein product [Schistocephalus solidus]|uniref:GIY-YIG domain-containing protein n=1 Tax=Schistocephalus solidus TaxID=70667 RepID=A0A183SD46_SCHSO|nr:unnamed protein product [Schistocephalus solidus]